MDPITAAFSSIFADSAAVSAGTAAATGAAAGDLAATAAGSVGVSSMLAGDVASGLAGIAGDSGATAALSGATAAADVADGAAVGTGISGLNFARMFNIGSTIFSTAGNYLQGKASATEKNFEANQLDRDAQAKRAAGTAEMQILGRNADLAISKARNNAAAGGGALDPSAVNIIGDLEKQGATNEATALYNADSAATSMNAQANADRFQAKQYGIGGDIGAVSSMFAGLSKSMAAKYGADTSTYGSYF